MAKALKMFRESHLITSKISRRYLESLRPSKIRPFLLKIFRKVYPRRSW